MKILADENLSQSIIKKLQKAGFDVLDIKRKSHRYQDKVLLKQAEEENRIIITFDTDFLQIMQLPDNRVKIILLRVQPQTKENMDAIVDFLLSSGFFKKLNRSAIISLQNNIISFTYN